MKRYPFFLCACLIFGVHKLIGQAAATPEIGANPYKSYSGGDFDHIQMQNGNMYLRVPLLSYPQLGQLKLSFSLQANSAQFEETATCDSLGDCSYFYTFRQTENCGPTNVGNTGLYYSVGGPANASIVLDQDVLLSECYFEPVDVDYWVYIGDQLVGQVLDENFFNIYSIEDSSGAVHTLGYDQSNWSVMQATDGSGYSVQMPWANSASAAANAASPPCGASTIIRDSSGISHTTATICNNVEEDEPSLVSTISDTNGNTITRSSEMKTSNGFGGLSTTYSSSITDSVGRIIPDPTGLGLTTDPNTSACPNLNIQGEPVQSSVSWNPPGYSGSAFTYHLCYSSAYVNTNFFGNGPGAYVYGNSGQQWCNDYDCFNIWYIDAETNGAVQVLQSIVLPNGTYWGFKYDTALTSTQTSYGDLQEVILPSGGSINYSYSMINLCGIASGDEMPQAGRAVTMRTANPLSGTPVTTRYSYMEAPSAFSNAYTIETDASGNDIVHVYTLDYQNGMNACGSKETATRWYQGPSNSATSGTVIKEVDTSYTDVMSPQDDYSNGYRQHINVLPQTTTTYLNGQFQNSISYSYDTLFTSSQPYTINGGTTPYVFPTTAGIRYPSATLVDDGIARTAVTRLAAVNGAYKAANLLGLPRQVVTADESGNPLSTTTFGYDETPSPQGIYGNSTSVLHDYGVKTKTQYNSLGMPCQTVDANQNVTIYNYGGSTGSCTAGLYITSVQAPSTNGIQHIRYFQQDQNMGWLTALTDENATSATDAQHATFYSYDALGRLTSVNYPDGGRVTQCYGDRGGQGCNQTSPPYSVVTQRLENATTTLTSQVNYDGLGRVVNDIAASGASTDTTYDLNGRIASISNRHFAAPSSTDGYTTFDYDALGRKLLQCQPDNGTGSGACTPGSSYLRWQYTGSTTDSWDENLTHMQHTSDARRRLVKVMELGTSADPRNLETDYSYDPLNNLTYVNQHGAAGETPRIRSFSYDSLSRLTTSTNPENGTICYGQRSGGSCITGYDANGNLLVKTDARGVAVTYTYDALNRVTAKQSTGGSGVTGFNYTYGYDTITPTAQPNLVGRLVWTSNNLNTTEIYSYDPVGRVTGHRVGLPSNYMPPWTTTMVTAVYDLAGNVTDLTYPDGRHLRQLWDDAGRLTSSALVDIGGVAQSQSYLNSASYNPDGSPSVLTFGNGLQQTIAKNSRLQMQSLAVHATTGPVTGTTFLSHSYCYTGCTAGGTANTGNIWGISDALSPVNTQGFTYDGLNRIASFTLNGALNQRYSIDSFGNMSGMSGSTVLSTFDSATNRISNLPCATVSLSYDTAGNQLCSTDTNGAVSQYSYDADSRVSQIAMLNSGTSPFVTYVYNGSGSRVRKSNASGTYTEYVDFASQPMAEKNGDGTWTDYIYANGQKVAKVDPTEVRVHVGGTYSADKSVSTWTLPNPLTGYVIKPHDKLMWKQYETGVAGGGLTMYVNNWTTTLNYQVFDQDGQWMAHDTTQNQWHNRVVDLNSYAGLAVNNTVFSTDTYMGGGAFNVWYKDVVLVSTDGTVIPLYTGQASESLIFWTSDSNPAAQSQTVDIATASPSGGFLSPSDTTTYFLDDHLGTTTMQFSNGGWPIWQGKFAPFGAELDTQQTSMHYKFTGKERDAESGLDDFGARYYGSSMGRFTSADPLWIKADRLMLPQRLNLYSYAVNNPIRFNDPTGMDVAIGGCPANMTTTMCEAAVRDGVPKGDRDHIHFVYGDGKNGFAKGQVGVLVDPDYKSSDSNFQLIQNAAKDHSALALLNFVPAGFAPQASWSESQGGSVSLMNFQDFAKSSTGFYMTMGNGLMGYSFFGLWGNPQLFYDGTGLPYADGKVSEIYVDAGLPLGKLAGTTYHELTHIVLGDFGRQAPKGGHGAPGVNDATKKAQKLGEKNAAQ